ncbi:hypothetical protein DKM44_08290 [Deinococcus irradiatisoli]|uniref:Uncharacterized protein n=1 Tax=Deinococcus irradiatisoli TaxID=2202254 RepID=A0A2Z3JE36_9DEIO|nr:hypothetical protein [Deinococcus irradiatisoli]AWN23225.1 hypothetical protein DKM44_08290 [Deinococcus irradiatisoli]
MKPDDWDAAMRAEAEHVPDSAWAAQTRQHLRAAQRRRRCGFGVALLLLAAVFLRLDWSASDTANQIALAWLLTSSFWLGWLSWNRASLVVATLALPLALVCWHAACVLCGLALPYEMQPAGLAGALSLGMLAVPALVVGGLGWRVRQGVRPR